MTLEEINNMKYKVCCPLCDNVKCVRGTDKCEAEMWAKFKVVDNKYMEVNADLGWELYGNSQR